MKFPFPTGLLNAVCSIALNAEGVSESGGSIASVSWNGMCIFSEKTKTVIDAEGKKVMLVGKVLCQGDIAPTLKKLTDGTVTIDSKVYQVFAAARPRNPDGSIHHTSLELM